MNEGRMTVERVFNTGGYWGAELHVDGRQFASVNYRHTEESLMIAANEIADRWNAVIDAGDILERQLRPVDAADARDVLRAATSRHLSSRSE